MYIHVLVDFPTIQAMLAPSGSKREQIIGAQEVGACVKTWHGVSMPRGSDEIRHNYNGRNVKLVYDRARSLTVC